VTPQNQPPAQSVCAWHAPIPLLELDEVLEDVLVLELVLVDEPDDDVLVDVLVEVLELELPLPPVAELVPEEPHAAALAATMTAKETVMETGRSLDEGRFIHSS
jgi:hypothetical protein